MVPGHFLWAGWFNCGCQGASLGARYWRTRLILSHFPVVLATRAQRARGQTNKRKLCLCASLYFASSEGKKRKEGKKEKLWNGQPKVRKWFPSSFDVKSLVSSEVHSLIKRRVGESFRWRWWRRKKWVRVDTFVCLFFNLQDRKEGSTVLVAIQIQVFSVWISVCRWVQMPCLSMLPSTLPSHFQPNFQTFSN